MQTATQDGSPNSLTLIPHQNSELRARLIRVNPAIFSPFFGIGIHGFFDQMLKLWPEWRIQALPYLSIPSVILAALGWKMAANSVRNPQQDIMTDPYKRTTIATLEGIGAVFPFLLGEIIAVYCKNPKNLDANHLCIVSDATFWGTFFPAPAILSGSYIAWNIVPATKKFTWSSHGIIQKYSLATIDVLSKTFFYSRILQTLIQNIKAVPQPITYEYAAIPAAVLVLVGQTLKPQHWQKLEAVIMYSMIANLMLYMASFLREEFAQAQQEQYAHSLLWSPILKTVAFSTLFVAGVFFTIRRCQQYFKTGDQLNNITFKPGHPLSFQQHMCNALQDPEKTDVIIKTILADPAIKQKLLAQLQESTTITSDTLPQMTPEELRADPKYEKIKQAILLDELGFTSENPNTSTQAETLRLSPSDPLYQQIRKIVLEDLGLTDLVAGMSQIHGTYELSQDSSKLQKANESSALLMFSAQQNSYNNGSLPHPQAADGPRPQRKPNI